MLLAPFITKEWAKQNREQQEEMRALIDSLRRNAWPFGFLAHGETPRVGGAGIDGI
jgi:hypothetical protein